MTILALLATTSGSQVCMRSYDCCAKLSVSRYVLIVVMQSAACAQPAATRSHLERAGGNVRLVQALAEHVPVMYNTPVGAVHYGSEGVTVVTEDGRALAADACVVSVPLGVLKASHIDFSPPLPQPKLDAIDRLGCVFANSRRHHLTLCLKWCCALDAVVGSATHIAAVL